MNPNIDDIIDFLTTLRDKSGGTLPELTRIAWDSYLSEIYIHQRSLDLSEFIRVRNEFAFPTNDNDPDANDPVLAIASGKYYVEDPSIPDGECVSQTTFEALSLDIRDVANHFGGELPPTFAVAYEAKLLAMSVTDEISDSEHEQLTSLLPTIDNSPIKDIKAFMQKYQHSGNCS